MRDLPSEEAFLRDEPTVHDCAVRIRESQGMRRFVCYVVPNGPFARVRIEQRLRERFLDDPTPTTVIPVAAIPLTESGEVDDAALADVPALDPEVLARLEARARSVEGTGDVATASVDLVGEIPPLHIDDLLTVATRPREPSAPRSAPVGRGADNLAPALLDGGPRVAAPCQTLGELLVRATKTAASARITYVGPEGEEASESYSELLERARLVAGGLSRRGYHDGRLVLLQLEDNRDFIAAFWGCVLAGAVAVPASIPATYTADNAAVAKLFRAWEKLGRPPILASEALAPSIRTVARERALEPVIETLSALAAGERRAEPHRARAEDPAVFLLTSGSTADSKVVVLSHDNLLAFCAGTNRGNDLGADDTSLNWMPLEHVGALADFHLRGMYAGASQVHVATSHIAGDPLRWLDLLAQHRVRVSWAPNFAYRSICERVAASPERHWDLSSLRFLINAGEGVVARTAQTFMSLLTPHGLGRGVIRPTWGMSETCSGALYGQLVDASRETDHERFADVGAPIPGVAVRIVNADNQVLREAEIGRLQIRGASVTRGYFDADEANAAAFTAEGWFNTGDLARIDGGVVTITGREKEILIINGANFAPQEFEAAVEEIAGVTSSFTGAFAVHDSDTDRLAICLHTTFTEHALAALVREIRGHVTKRFGVVPDYIVPLPQNAIPKTAIGKIQRTELQRRFLGGEYAALLRRIEVLSHGPRTLPDWFFRVVWCRREPAPRPRHGGVLVVGERSELRDAVVDGLRRASRAAHVVEHMRDVSRLDDVGDLVWLGLEPMDDGTGDVLSLAKTLAARVESAPLRVLHVSRSAQQVDVADAGAPSTAALIALLRTLPLEHALVRCRSLDLDAGSGASIDAARVLSELDCNDELEVAYRRGVRLCRRLEKVDLAAASPAPPLVQGGFYVITGGLGGIGQIVARYLLDHCRANVLLVGRTSADGLSNATRATLAELRQHPGTVEYRAVDVADPDRLAAVVRELETQFGRLFDGVFHLAGTYAERALAELSPESLAAAMHGKALGLSAIDHLLRDRDDALLVAFSSAATVFGAALLGSYTAANRYLEAYVRRRRARGGTRSYSLAWTNWTDIGMSRGNAVEGAERARGFARVSAEQGMRSLAAVLHHDVSDVVIGLDRSRPNVRRFLRGDTPVLDRAVVRFTGRVDPAALSALGVVDALGTAVQPDVVHVPELPRAADGTDQPTGAKEDGFVAPSTPIQDKLASIWCEILQIERVGVHDDFFELGGRSLLVIRLAAMIKRAFAVQVPVRTIFDNPTIAELSALIAQQTRGPEASGAGPNYVASTVTDELAMTPQYYFYYLDRDDHNRSYLNTVVTIVEGPLDAELLAQSYRAVVARHGIYRTVYREVEGALHQIVKEAADPSALDLEVVDRGHIAQPEEVDEIKQVASELIGRGYDLARGVGLLRTCLIRFGAERHALVIVVHHIAMDGPSESSLRQEMFEDYLQRKDGKPPATVPKMQYIDFAHARQQWAASPAGLAEDAFWRRHLQGAPPVVLEGDFPRAPIDARRDAAPFGITADLSHRAETIRLPDAVYASVVEAAAAARTTPYVVFLNALAWLLHERSGQTDLTIQTSFNMRGQDAALDRVHGCLAVWTVVRIELARAAQLADLIARTKAAVDLQHDHGVPHDFYRVVPHYLRRVVFNYLPAPSAAPSRYGDLTLVRQPGLPPRWQRTWDLHLTLVDSSTSAILHWTGFEQLFSRQTVLALLNRYVELLASSSASA